MSSAKTAEYKLLLIGNENGLEAERIVVVKKWVDKNIHVSR